MLTLPVCFCPRGSQVITGSHDSTIRLWDLRKGKTMVNLTYHKKSVRAMASHPNGEGWGGGGIEQGMWWGRGRGGERVRVSGAHL